MLIEKLILGVTLAAPIGPISIEMIKRGLKNGFWASFNVRLGGALGQSLCLVGSFFGLSKLQEYPHVIDMLGIFGVCFLIYLGISTMLRILHTIDYKEFPIHKGSGLGVGLMLAFANPISIVFWLGIFAATMQASDADNSMLGLLYNFNIIVGVLLWGAFLSAMLQIGSKLLNTKTIRAISFVSGLLMVGYGVKYGYPLLLKFI